MAKTVISVENLSKIYDLGVIGATTFHRDLGRWVALARGKPDPYTKIGHVDRFKRRGMSILALDDVSFKVQEGEALGIIGKNGAGKSTLLKILSRVTAPTEGIVRVRGRIGSLLEVGTGFHPELTGRENVYLNGAILGMTRAEVDRKFDEIVDFSGVEQFIDTPVKRFSSGMKVRLGFAVAAHLDPEILVVDEVLAVGDAEFQKKCLGKMGDVTGEGRTVLFVSHIMQAVQNLCEKAMVIDQGRLVFNGYTDSAVSYYLRTSINTQHVVVWDQDQAPGNDSIRLTKAWVKKAKLDAEDTIIKTSDDLEIGMEFINLIPGDSLLGVTMYLQNEQNILVFVTDSSRVSLNPIQPGKYRSTCYIPGNLLNQGTYTIKRLLFIENRGRVVYEHLNTLTFEVAVPNEGMFGYMGRKEGVVRPSLNWSFDRIG